MTSPLRILIAAHSHPRLSKGGAEIAAYEMFDRLHQSGDHAVNFLGCQRPNQGGRLGSPITQPFADNDYLYTTHSFDWFKFANPDPEFPRALQRLLTELQPDIVHFHHYINFGVETFAHVKSALPNARIVLTLHEYLALCNHFGQMITTGRHSLCYQSTPRRCATCFPAHSPADFFLRKLYIDRFFAHIDAFIAPSQFLAERYIAWGIPAARMTVIENIIRAPTPQSQPPTPVTGPTTDNRLLRIGFFGQVSHLKGIDILFEAARILDDDGVTGVSFEIHGDYQGQPDAFQTAFLASLAKSSRNIRFLGPYDQSNVDRLMSATDAVVVPSIWWENSPVVIQEALRNHRPVICSDIGGMAEKIRDGIDGFHFPAGSAYALADLIRRLVADPTLLTTLRQSLAQPPDAEYIVNEHLNLYQSIQATSFDQKPIKTRSFQQP